jgi:hypothetical protein
MQMRHAVLTKKGNVTVSVPTWESTAGHDAKPFPDYLEDFKTVQKASKLVDLVPPRKLYETTMSFTAVSFLVPNTQVNKMVEVNPTLPFVHHHTCINGFYANMIMKCRGCWQGQSMKVKGETCVTTTHCPEKRKMSS